MAVTLTDAAARHVSGMINKRGQGLGIRIGTKKSGCTGFAYEVDYADCIEERDQVFESHGVKVYVDAKSLSYIDGTQLDYAKEGLNEGFKFANPNEKATCGCGESFTV